MTTKRVSDFITAFQYQTEQPSFRGRVIVDVCRKLKLAAPRIVEVGVFTGALSAYLLRELPTCRLVMVDAWKAYDEVTDDEISHLTGEEMQAIRDYAHHATAFAIDRRWIFSVDSLTASRRVYDRDMDIVFLDADHSYEAVAADIAAWWPKVKQNGVLCGHDWGYPATSVGVERAVREFVARTEGLTIRWSQDYVWLVQKRMKNPTREAAP